MLKFKAYLVENGIKQKEVSDLLGLTLPCFNRKLNGKEPFTFEQIKTICKHYNISADEYFI